jgi:hypothetical protein
VLLRAILFDVGHTPDHHPRQFVSYFRSYRDDKGGLQLAVAVLAVLTTLKSCDVLFAIYLQREFHSRLTNSRRQRHHLAQLRRAVRRPAQRGFVELLDRGVVANRKYLDGRRPRFSTPQKLTVFVQGATINILVQAYFCFRLNAISKKWYVVAPAVALCVFSYIAAIINVRSCIVSPFSIV